jgi:adenylate cyclase
VPPGLTRLDTPEPELAYLFKHIVTRDVAYDSLPFATRARLHEDLGAYVEALGEPLPLDLLAHHYELSNHLGKRREYLQRAALAAKASYANATALSYFERLLPLLEQPVEQLEVHLARGDVLVVVGRWVEAEAAFDSALALATKADANEACARCETALGNLFRKRGRFEQALAHLERARAAFESLDHTVALAQTLSWIGNTHFFAGNYALALHNLGAALVLARASNDRQVLAGALGMLGIVADVQGDSAARDAYYQEAVAIEVALGDRRRLAGLRQNMGTAAAGHGDVPVARALYEESIALYP